MAYPAPALDRTSRCSTIQRPEGDQETLDGLRISLRTDDIDALGCPQWMSLSYTWTTFSSYGEQDSQPSNRFGDCFAFLNSMKTTITFNLWHALNAILTQREANCVRSGYGTPVWLANTDYF
jgi:hypothetical protein